MSPFETIKKFLAKPKNLIFLDTSGSMFDEKNMYWVKSQLDILGIKHAIVVPNDTSPYWESKQTLKDLSKIKTSSYGGTSFEQIFEEYPQQVGSNFDTIVVITDGYIFDLRELKKPAEATKTIWLLTIDNPDFKKNIPFGRYISQK